MVKRAKRNNLIITEEVRSFEIVRRIYVKKLLTIGAPNSDIANEGRFKEVIIEDLAHVVIRHAEGVHETRGAQAKSLRHIAAQQAG